MSVFTIILLIGGAGSLVFCAIGWSMAPKWKMEESIYIGSERGKLYDFLEYLPNWEIWTIWNAKENAHFIFHYMGAERGEGAQQCWKNRKHYGYTKLCTCRRPEYLEFLIVFGRSKSQMRGKLHLRPRGTSTEVLWSISGDAGHNPFKRLMVRFFSSFMRRDLQRSLKRLKDLMEAEPAAKESA